MVVRPFVVLAIIRYIATGWPTTRRMFREVASRLFGCCAAGADDLPRCIACTWLALVTQQRRRRAQVWRLACHIRLACHVVLLNRNDTIASGVWPYVTHTECGLPLGPTLVFSALHTPRGTHTQLCTPRSCVRERRIRAVVPGVL